MVHLSVFCSAKAGMSSVDTSRVNSVVYEASKDSAHFRHQQATAAKTAVRIAAMHRRVAAIRASPPSLLYSLSLRATTLLTSLEQQRDLTRTWLHCDMDSFYASCELLDRPHLAHLPVAVGSLSMITTSNYVARQYGVRAAMPGFIAVKLCPQLVFVPCNFARYRQVADVFRGVFREYDADFESASLDEAYLDVTECLRRRREQREAEQGVEGVWDHAAEAQAVASEMRRRVFDATRLTCSCGIACNRMLAKIATDVNKPNGQYYLPPSLPAVLAFLQHLPVRKVCGIGRVQERILHELGIVEVADIRSDRFAPLIVDVFSDITARWLFAVSLGLGRTAHEEEEERRRKSVSCERTFRDIDRLVELEEKVEDIARSLADDVEAIGAKGRTLTLKLKTSTFEVKQRSHTVHMGWIRSFDDIQRVGLLLLKEELNLLRSGQRVHQSAAAGSPGRVGGGGPKERGGGGLGRSAFDGLLRLRLMGLRLSSLAAEEVEEGEEGGEKSRRGSILRYAQKLDDASATPEAELVVCESGGEEGAVKRRKQQGSDRDISRYFGLGAAGEEVAREGPADGVEGKVERAGGERKGRGSRRRIVDFFHHAAAASSTASAAAGGDDDDDDGDIEELMRPSEREEDDWTAMADDPQAEAAPSDTSRDSATVSSSPLMSAPPAPLPPPPPAALALSAPAAAPADVSCPVCGVQLGVGVGNVELNAHLDRCLRGGGQRSAKTPGKVGGRKRKDGRGERGGRGGAGRPPTTTSLTDLWQRKQP